MGQFINYGNNERLVSTGWIICVAILAFCYTCEFIKLKKNRTIKAKKPKKIKNYEFVKFWFMIAVLIYLLSFSICTFIKITFTRGGF